VQSHPLEAKKSCGKSLWDVETILPLLQSEIFGIEEKQTSTDNDMHSLQYETHGKAMRVNENQTKSALERGEK